MRESVVNKAWDQIHQSHEQNLFFGSCSTNVDISTLHPDQVQIFRLWQIYLDNINPLLKVTHTPTLQPRMIDAAGNVTNISPTLEALMFSIYCVSILSLDEDECRASFRTSRDDLLKRYRFACQQSLLKCGVLRTRSVECLTALYLYLVSTPSGVLAYILLTPTDLGQALCRPAVCILNAWYCYPHCTTYGH